MSHNGLSWASGSDGGGSGWLGLVASELVMGAVVAAEVVSRLGVETGAVGAGVSMAGQLGYDGVSLWLGTRAGESVGGGGVEVVLVVSLLFWCGAGGLICSGFGVSSRRADSAILPLW